ncbi:putative formin, FH2 domain-containing protein [Helianthus annuus]|uniref:Formin-like protein n=1 Tax=Helianthus annuus TaxID=4232 RepID=A0A251VQX9_HELAN|nr:formin-like protein 2 [Helianthus annuus]KAF5823151.1 putative formin, FH2 domain-containing protein [Helianthus annuus]KAJ0949200.1 putative formin, FH2 domain-containing protein [Helianthus annuus]
MKIIFFLLLISLFISHSSSHRILHQPFFPVTDTPPPPPTTTQPPSLPPSPQPQPQSQPKYPFSSLTPPTPTQPTHHHHNHFFPFFTTPPTPTTTTNPTIPTFPANISSITLPSPSSSSTKQHDSKKLLSLSLTLSLISILFIATIATTLLYRRTHHHKPPSSDSLRLFPANLPTSDKPPPPGPPPTLPPNFSTPSTEFLYLGTLVSPLHDPPPPPKPPTTTNTVTYATMGSPELHPLPPLPRQDFNNQNNVEECSLTDSEVDGHENFFSPRGSPVVLHTVAPPPPPPPAPATAGGFMERQRKEEVLKPKLKALHWDKVKSSSEKAMVWDQLKFSTSFQLNEEKIETLFRAKSSSTVAPNHSTNEPVVRPMAAEMTQRTRVLDPHKSRNIAILLRAFNLTIDEVCECILQGNVDSLGSELLGSLLKMAPTMEEEAGLKEMNGALFDPAEKFLKAVIDIPFAFKRVDAMLYISNFDNEVDYLKGSFDMIKSACQQLRNSRMFIKLLEAVLVAGNRLNTGTNRGDAQAFRLDTLLKLIDVKGIDGKTTLLHFVVQEIARTEGRVSQVNQQSELCDEVESTKRGLEVVSSLSGELSSVKKAATMDIDMLSKEAERLATGLTKINEMVALNERCGSNKRFSDSMNMFLKKAGDDIIQIEGEERVAVSMVKETTEYFHGSSTIEESQPLWIFMVVRDFLLVLDRVSKDVGKSNERTTVGSRSLPSVFPRFNGPLDFSSFDG